MKYLAVSLEEGGEWDATVQADVGCDSLARSGRLARAMRAVLLAVRAWARAAARYAAAEQKGVLYCNGATFVYQRADAERRLYAAQERLAKIEKEVSRG